MSEMPMCEVCGKERSIIIGASALGAISHAYCDSCSAGAAEPYVTLVGMLWSIGGRDRADEWVDEIITASLAVAGKTLEQLDADVADIDRQYRADEENWRLSTLGQNPPRR